MNQVIWSSSDSPYTCLKDMERTLAFRKAIEATVRPGDIVLEAGAGTGILSFFAAAAGAAHVYAVEIDGLLAAALRRSVDLNGLAGRITVIAGDAATSDLPSQVDVVIGELLETGLLDEEQVRVINALHRRGLLDGRSRLIPERYATSIELVEVDDAFYGFRIAAPFHEWPNYATDRTRWHPTPVTALTDRAVLSEIDFSAPVEPLVERALEVRCQTAGRVTSVRISGIAHLTPSQALAQTNAVNGDKIVHLPTPIAVRPGDLIHLDVRYTMGGGLHTFDVQAHVVDDQPCPEECGR